MIGSDNADFKRQEATQPTVQMTSETNHGRQRHSLIGLFTGDHGPKSTSEHPHTTLPTKGIFFQKLNYVLREQFQYQNPRQVLVMSQLPIKLQVMDKKTKLMVDQPFVMQ